MHAIMAGLLFWIFQKDCDFPWEAKEKKAMVILQNALCNAPVMKILDISNGIKQIVMGVDAS